MITDDASTEEADGEPLIHAAAADGWALDRRRAGVTSRAKAQRRCCDSHTRLQFLIDAGTTKGDGVQLWLVPCCREG